MTCPDSKCREDLSGKIQRLVKKKTVARVAKWASLPFFGLLSYGVVLWAQQEADPLRYTTKRTMAAHVAQNRETRAIVDNLVKHRDEDRIVQREIQSDIKEILRYMRNK